MIVHLESREARFAGTGSPMRAARRLWAIERAWTNENQKRRSAPGCDLGIDSMNLPPAAGGSGELSYRERTAIAAAPKPNLGQLSNESNLALRKVRQK